MNNQEDFQRLLKKEYLLGPEVMMVNQVGINYYSGTKSSAFYELWGEKEIFRLLILRPSSNLFASKFVGKNHLIFLLIVEDDQLIGGFVSLQENMLEQLTSVLHNLNEKSLKELEDLWSLFVKDHYAQLPTDNIR
ncbi:hypothetical protein GZH47_09335 [Paenibacillus rhizovicinus]|uniref:Uncharacterized protein n=1 Tax=Paenibacillus rhizovicinus TaxID=2704463 RepID=A0A6C0NXW5_9BACL|nr:hypothetical protein [Paenibacillus rhizovicinus]QHW31038.1 hypothetical protein GZH47_09335 [Paenibacillus rhizovicinus]